MVIEHMNKVDCEVLQAKMDIESTYWIIPVHLKDRPLLGVKWKGALFFDQCLPFRLRSAPKIFTAVADGSSNRRECTG